MISIWANIWRQFNFLNLGPPKEDIFLTTFYGLYFSYHHTLHCLLGLWGQLPCTVHERSIYPVYPHRDLIHRSLETCHLLNETRAPTIQATMKAIQFFNNKPHKYFDNPSIFYQIDAVHLIGDCESPKFFRQATYLPFNFNFSKARFH